MNRVAPDLHGPGIHGRQGGAREETIRSLVARRDRRLRLGQRAGADEIARGERRRFRPPPAAAKFRETERRAAQRVPARAFGDRLAVSRETDRESRQLLHGLGISAGLMTRFPDDERSVQPIAATKSAG